MATKDAHIGHVELDERYKGDPEYRARQKSLGKLPPGVKREERLPRLSLPSFKLPSFRLGRSSDTSRATNANEKKKGKVNVWRSPIFFYLAFGLFSFGSSMTAFLQKETGVKIFGAILLIVASLILAVFIWHILEHIGDRLEKNIGDRLLQNQKAFQEEQSDYIMMRMGEIERSLSKLVKGEKLDPPPLPKEAEVKH